MHYGMIATGNHGYLDSLRDAQPSLNLPQLSTFSFASPHETAVIVGSPFVGQRGNLNSNPPHCGVTMLKGSSYP